MKQNKSTSGPSDLSLWLKFIVVHVDHVVRAAASKGFETDPQKIESSVSKIKETCEINHAEDAVICLDTESIYLEVLPPPLVESFLEHLNEIDSAAGFTSDPVFYHPVKAGPLRSSAEKVFEAQKNRPFTSLKDLFPLVPAKEVMDWVQAMVFHPLTGLWQDFLEKESADGEFPVEIDMASLPQEVLTCIERWQALIEKFDPGVLGALLKEVAGEAGWQLAENLEESLENEQALLRFLIDICKDRKTLKMLPALETILIEQSGSHGCRVRITGPKVVKIGERVWYRAHLDAGEKGGTYHWDSLPSGKGSAWIGSSTTPVGPAMRYGARYHLAGSGIIRVRYVSPGGQVCWAVMEIEHVNPECLVRFRPQRALLEYGQQVDYRVESFPDSDVRFSVAVDPAGASTHALIGRNQIRVTAGAVDAKVTITATHGDMNCSVEKLIRIRAPEKVPGEGEDDVNCSVKIVEGPTQLDEGQQGVYRAQGRPPDGDYSWRVTGDARIIGPADNDTVTVKAGKTDFTLHVEYQKEGCTAHGSVFEVKVVLGDDPRDVGDPTIYGEEVDQEEGVALVRVRDPNKLIPSIPLVQHAPNCKPFSPKDGGDPLAPGSDFIISAIRLFEDWEDPDTTVLGLSSFNLAHLNPSVKVELRCEGSLWDTLEVILGMSVDVVGQRTFDFEPGEYWKSGFRKWHPNQLKSNKNVTVEGLGVHHLRFRPLNGILIQGKYHLDLVTELSDASAGAISDATRHLNDLMAMSTTGMEPAARQAHAARITNSSRNLVSAWRAGLKHAVVRTRHNIHRPHSTVINTDCRFRVRGFTDQTPVPALSPAQVEAEPEPVEDITLQRDANDRLLSKKPNPDFFVTKTQYPDSGPVTFNKDGLLRGQVLKNTVGYYPPGGLTDKDTIYGIDVRGPDCIELDDPNHNITLTAQGIPPAIGQWIGQYTWSMACWPDGATWTFTPKGPVPNPVTEVTVDRPGYYVARVDYVVDAVVHQCHQTYALFEFQAVKNAPPTMNLLRLGEYPEQLNDHLHRPFYRRRTLEQQEGADLIVLPRYSATLGHKQQLMLSVPPELVLSLELTARVYTKADRSEYKDYMGAPFIRMSSALPSAAEINIESLEPIYGIHMICIRYSNLLKLPGHAVEVTLMPLSKSQCQRDRRWREPNDDTLPSPSGGSFGSAYEEEYIVTRPPEDVPVMLKRVNLLLYEHDLGDADASNGTTAALPGSDKIMVNLPNGNMHFEYNCFNWEGKGQTLQFDLHYNSFHAAQMEAAERMAGINNVSLKEREEEYARTMAGFGWSHTFGTHLIDYVLSEEGNHIRKRLELVDDDGNHIQFEAVNSDGNEYRPVQRGTLFENDAEVGAVLVITESGDAGQAPTGYELTDLYKTIWEFDEKGRLIKIATRASQQSNGALKPINIEYQPQRIDITDSVDRTMILRKNRVFRVNQVEDGVAATWKLEDGTSGHLMGTLRIQNDFVFSVTYDEYYFMDTLKNGRFKETQFIHYKRDDAWGRIRKVSREDLDWRASYRTVEATDLSKGFWTDARRTDHRLTWDRDSLSVTLHDVYRPSYENELGSIPGGYETLEAFEYYSEPGLGTGKLVTRHIDEWEQVKSTEYKAGHMTRSFRPEKVLVNHQLLYTYTWDPDTELIYEKTDADQNKTTHTYDRFGNLAKVELPSVKQGRPAPYEAWKYAADGTLTWERNAAGIMTTLAYGGTKDPHHTGLPTTRTKGGLSWIQEFAKTGLLSSAIEPFYYGKTEYRHDNRGRVTRIIHPEIPVVDDPHQPSPRPYKEIEQIRYDGNGNLQRRELYGLWEQYTYDDHDRIKTEQDGDGTVRYKHDGLGAVLERTDRRGSTWFSEYDHLGRVVEIRHPRSSGGRLIEYFKREKGPKGEILYHLEGKLATDGHSVLYPRRLHKSTFNHKRQKLEFESYTELQGQTSPKSRWAYERNRYGHMKSLSYSVNGAEKYKETYTLDSWYRIVQITVDDAVTDYTFGPMSEIVSVTTPHHGAGSRATWRFTYDDHLRDKTVKDPYNRVVREIVYHDANRNAPARKEIKGMPHHTPAGDPKQHQTGSVPLQVLKHGTYNSRGRVTEEITSGLKPKQLYYDRRARLVAQVQGTSHIGFTLDDIGRRTQVRSKDARTTTTTQRKFDGEGNLTEVWGSKFIMRYAYDALDRMTSELRKYYGGSWETVQDVRYDIFGRARRKSTNLGQTVTRYAYRDDTSTIRYQTGEQGTYQASVEARFHWNGEYSYYRRTEPGGKVPQLVQTTGEPDKKGRIPWMKTQIGGLEGTISYQHFPAGTRQFRRLQTSGRSYDQGPYHYYPDWQVKTIGSDMAGSYTFRYRASGALSSWQTPRGHEFALQYNAYGGVKDIDALRSGSPQSRFAKGEVELLPQADPNHPKERVSVLDLHHQSTETPDSGNTRYQTIAGYQSGHVSRLEHWRRGSTGRPAVREIDMSYGYRGIFRQEEQFRYPDSPDKNFSVTRSYTYQGDSTIIESSTTSDEASLITQHAGVHASSADADGRILRTRDRNLVDPDVMTLIGDPKYWLHTNRSLDRDELGRVRKATTRIATSRGDDPQGRTTYRTTPNKTDVYFVRDPGGRVVYRKAVIKTVNEDGDKVTLNDERIYLYDGQDVMAEVKKSGTSSQVERVFEYGPAKGFRLNVRHTRGGFETVDEYLYGVGLTPFALADAQGDVVMRFSIADLPAPGDDRLGRLSSDSPHPSDAQAVNMASALYSPAFQPPLGGLPPGVGPASVTPVGAALSRGPGEKALGFLKPPSNLVDEMFQPQSEMVDPSEMPRPAANDSLWNDIASAMDTFLSVNPLTAIGYRMAKGIHHTIGKGDETDIRFMVSDLLWTVVQAILKMPLNPIQPLQMWASGEDYGPADYALAAFDVRDSLVMINGYDPVTGATFSWDDRIFGGQTLALALVSSVPGGRAPRTGPKIGSDIGCFPAGTRIRVPGGFVPIETLWPNEKILAMGNKGPETARVEHVDVIPNAELIELFFANNANENGSSTLVTTLSQPFLVSGKGFVSARDLEPGDPVQGMGRHIYRFAGISRLGRYQTVYQLSVPGWGNYLVEDQGVVAHNSIRGALLRLRAMRNLPNKIQYTPHPSSTRTVQVLTGTGTTPSGRQQTYIKFRFRVRSSWTPNQVRLFARKLQKILPSGEQALLKPSNSPHRVSTTNMLRQAVAEKYGLTVEQVAAMGLDMDHAVELVAGGRDLTPEYLNDVSALRDAGLDVPFDFLWALDPSVNRSSGSRMRVAMRRWRALSTGEPIIFAGVSPAVEF